MMNETNVNLSKCIQEVHGIGVDYFHNICDGSVVNLSWGLGDWIGIGFVSLLLLFFISFIIIMLISICKDMII